MLTQSFLVPLLASLGVAAIASSANTTSAAPVVVGAYIIELEDDQGASEFLQDITDDARVRTRLNAGVFNGVSIQFRNLTGTEDRAATVTLLPGVKNIWPVREYSLPDYTTHWRGTPGIALLSRCQDSRDELAPHVMTQVDLLRGEGVTGKGVKIGVIDTGIDYLHPALGGCLGPDCLVSNGWDFVGDDFGGATSTPIPGPDPMDCAGHGTHVAGIIAAQENDLGFTGAAPGVKLGAYKVFSCTGNTSNDILIAAFLKAYSDGSDVITASLGADSGWSGDPLAIVVSRIVEAGVPCTVATGNSGSSGLFVAGSPASGKEVTAIGSSDSVISPMLVAMYLPLWPVSNLGCLGSPDYPGEPDLSGYIALIRRGDCARHMLIVNNKAGIEEIGAFYRETFDGSGMVTQDQGEEWFDSLAKGEKVVVGLANLASKDRHLVEMANPTTGGFSSIFTSWGPTYELAVKPQLSEPGGFILSTMPRALGSYGVLSGTVRKTFDPATLEHLLTSTSVPSFFNDGSTKEYSVLAPVPQQGAGMVRAHAAAHATTLLSVSSLAFKDKGLFQKTKSFTVYNTGSSPVTYKLGHTTAAATVTMDAAYNMPAAFPADFISSYASLDFSESSITVPAGGSADISVTVTPPQGVDDSIVDRLPIYPGYITLNGTNGDGLSLPYQGATQAPDSTIILPKAGTATPDMLTLPLINYYLVFGSRLLRADVSRVVSNSSADSRHGSTILGTWSLGNAAGFPIRYGPNLVALIPWDGQLEDRTYTPAGTYTIVIKALKIFGNETNQDDYQAISSQPFSIVYAE
ncbi:subtilisin-like serine protease PR1C [Ilyonectria robusta]|uniref:subtilisin-like serine protease PR1C n=1 Tax=Ilyonectria robusta TaxID=1079257 RepID=UPI001E8EB406|nr:subtilisin-like serine protease PR1C [Ilyonectria robusta]KAH8714724.1 subtilisin-like serine protease PR1C [Ilyonectria robusta]